MHNESDLRIYALANVAKNRFRATAGLAAWMMCRSQRPRFESA